MPSRVLDLSIKAGWYEARIEWDDLENIAKMSSRFGALRRLQLTLSLYYTPSVFSTVVERWVQGILRPISSVLGDHFVLEVDCDHHQSGFQYVHPLRTLLHSRR